MGHDLEVEGDVLHLVEGDGLDEEGDVGVAAAELLQGLGGLAQVADVRAGANGLLVEAEELFEDDLVELSDVELLLARGEAGE